MEKDREEIIQLLADKYKVSTKLVQEIINYQFKYVTKIMKKGDFDTIRLPYFGKFIVNFKRIKHINNLKKKKNG